MPHNVFYAYEEVLAAFKDKPSDPKTVLSAFVRMTGHITDRDVTDYRLTIAPEEQQRFLEGFAVTAASAAAKLSSPGPVETEDEILVRTVEAAFASLTDDQRAIAQRVFGRLVRIGRVEEGGGMSAIRAAIGDFNDAERSVIALLEKQGVLSVSTLAQAYGTSTYGSSSRSSTGQTVGFANEKLLRLSKTIIGWIEGDREFLLWRQQLRTYVSDWERSDRKAPAVLGGTLFTEASYWFERRKRDLNQAETDFIWQASVTIQEAIPGPPRAKFKPRPQAAPAPLDDLTRLSAPAAVTAAKSPRRLPRWLGLATAAAVVLALALGGLFFARRVAPTAVQPAGNVRDAVIVAAATAASDPLRRALLLLELGHGADAPSNARDLAIDLATTTLPWALLSNDAHPITVGRFGADGNSFATGSSDGTVKVWRDAQEPRAWTTNVGGTVSIALDPRRGQLFVTGANHVAEVWDLESRQAVNRLPIASNILDGTMNDGVPIVIQPVGSGRGGTTYLARFKGQRAEEFRAEDFSTVATLLPGTTAVRFNASGEWGVAVRGSTVNVWQLAGGRLQRSIEADSARSVVFSPNGAYLAYETSSGISVVSLSRAGTEAGGARAEETRRREEFLADEQRRVAAGRAPARPSAVAQSSAPNDGNPPLAVSPDGQVVVVTIADGTALLVPAVDLSVSRASPSADDPRWLRGHSGRIVDVDFSLDGSLIATSGFDGTSRLWRNPIGRPTPARPPSSSSWGDLWKTLRDRTTACLSTDERVRLLNEPEAGAREAVAKCNADYRGKVFAVAGPTS